MIIINNIIMIGRLVRDPELRFTQGGTAVAKFSLAVDRDFKTEGQPDADFFNIVVWGKQAESVANNLNKGRKVAINGRLQNNNFEDKNGVKHFGVDVVANRVEFLDYANNEKSAKKQEPETSVRNDYNGTDQFSGFQAIDDSEDIPF